HLTGLNSNAAISGMADPYPKPLLRIAVAVGISKSDRRLACFHYHGACTRCAVWNRNLCHGQPVQNLDLPYGLSGLSLRIRHDLAEVEGAERSERFVPRIA